MKYKSFISIAFSFVIVVLLSTTVAQQAPLKSSIVGDTSEILFTSEPSKLPNGVVDTTNGLEKVPLRSPQMNVQVDRIIGYAKELLGTPYRYSGSTPSGFDCSGFITYVLGNFGFDLGRSSYNIADFGKTVRLSELQPGDLLFFKGSNVHSSRIGHVAMVVEVNENAINFIHSATSRGVVIDNFKTSRYFIPRFVKAKRLDYGGN